MGILSHKPPWYAAGLAFECLHCGGCCAGPEEGYVWVSRQEIDAIAEYLGLGASEVVSRYVRRNCGRFSLIEHPTTRDCVFLTAQPDGPGKPCAVYPVRPMQCRTWPFWRINLAGPRSWAEAGQRCPGINRGRLYSHDEIQSRLHANAE